MKDSSQPEFWQRGPIMGIQPLLQPVVHAILQARQEIQQSLIDFPDQLLWARPGGVASVAFHLQHLSGVLDRLFTYARAEMLSEDQLAFLNSEGVEVSNPTVASLVLAFSGQVDLCIDQLRQTAVDTLLEYREIGRKKIPSNVIGLLFHAAEHTQRHTGQLLVTARVARLKPA